jgi:uncharacterized phiE125 gp8 family phage protein
LYKGTLVLKNVTTGEVISAADVKENSRIDSVSYIDDITQTNSINVAEYAVQTKTGIGIDVSGAGEIVALMPIGAVSSGVSAELITYLEESDDDFIYASVTGSTFTTVSTGNQNTTLEKAYTGDKQYIRAIGTNTGGIVNYGVIIQEKTPASNEDAWINDTITSVREYAEQIQDKTFRTTDYYYYLPEFPDEDYIELPRAPLQSINSITYKDNDGIIITLTTDNYNYDTKSFPAKIWLEYNKSWPSFTEYPFNAVTIDFTAGSTSVEEFKKENQTLYRWMLAAIGDLYTNREKTIEEFDQRGLMCRRIKSFK